MITLKFICLIFMLILTGIVVCKPDYIFHSEAQGWLKLHYVPATWEDAFLSCHYEGAVLASPLNQELASAMRNIMNKTDVNRIFIGANALFSAGDYISVEGVSLADMPVTWDTNYLYDGHKLEDCLTITSPSGKVHASSCTQWLPYMCFKKQENHTILNVCGTFDNKYHYEASTGSCYKVHEEHKSWDVAHKICIAEGGYLVIINDKTEFEIIKAIMPSFSSLSVHGRSSWSPIHIGLRDWNNKKGMHNWLTIHGEKMKTGVVTWNRNQPDDADQICGCILREGYLDYNWCSVKTLFICEKDPRKIRFELSKCVDSENLSENDN